MGALVFANEPERKKLEAITHPLINRELLRRVEAIVHDDANAVIIVEVPLLFESGMDKQMDEVWVVVADDQVRLERLMARNGYTEAEARARMDSQMPQQEKILRASAVIDNSGAPEKTRAQVEALFAQRRV
jgi:dephospho-CoA kinase